MNNVTNTTTKRVRVWPLWLLAAPAATSIWGGWVGLGGLAGFGVIHPLPGTPWESWSLDTAITLPIGVETYAAYAMYVWLTSHEVSPTARRFARASTVASLLLGATGQVAYHLMAAAGYTAAPWQITALVACLPVLVLGMGAALAHLVAAGDDTHVLAIDETQELLQSKYVAKAAATDAGEDWADRRSVANTMQTYLAARGDNTPAEPAKPARTRAGRGPGRPAGSDARARVAKALAAKPGATQAQIAAMAGVSERTVRRVIAATEPTTTEPTAPEGRAPEARATSTTTEPGDTGTAQAAPVADQAA